jgi:hypothetical protein
LLAVNDIGAIGNYNQAVAANAPKRADSTLKFTRTVVPNRAAPIAAMKGVVAMVERNTYDGRTTVNLAQRKYPRRHIPKRDGVIDSFRPLTFQSAGNLDLDVEHVHVFPERGSIVLSLVTGTGTATFVMPIALASEVGEGLSWLAAQESARMSASPDRGHTDASADGS